MSFLIVANFKSNKTITEVKSWIKAVKPTPSMVVAPSFPHLSTIHDLTPTISLAAQDVSPFPPGSYTGAVSARELKDLGVSYCLVGHSERRRYFHETAADVANKVTELLAVDITPIVCLSQADIDPQFGALDSTQIKHCIFCFEPPADIGGTETAPVADIARVVAQIKETFSTGQVMYGGSVTAENIASLLPLGLNGVLVATASLDPTSFISIIQKSSHAR